MYPTPRNASQEARPENAPLNQTLPENVPQIQIPQTPRTPNKNQTHGPPVVESTPASKKFCAHAEDIVAQRASVVNKFLEDDINDRVVFSLNEFATLILDLPPDWEVEQEFRLLPESRAVKEAFEAYLKLADGEGQKRNGMASREKELYQPLVNLLNALRDGSGCVGKDINEKMFYVQDPRPVLGSLIQRKPDLGGIYNRLLKLTKNKKLSEYLAKKKVKGVFWGLLLFFVEVKHRKGNFVGLNTHKEASRAPSTSQIPSTTLPSIEYALSQSNAIPPSATTTTSNIADEPRPQVIIHEHGGKEKTLEVITSQDYQLRADSEVDAEDLMTPTQGQHHTRIQCASYAKEMLSSGYIRNHALGITADDSSFRFHYYDHSKVIESQAFHIVDKECTKLFMAMVCQLNKLSTEKLGYIPNLDLSDFNYLRDPKQLLMKMKDNPQGLIGSTYRLKGSDGKTRTVVIKAVLYRAEGIVGRCSIVVEVECICTESSCTWHGERKVMKISFPSRSRIPEDVLIREARTEAESSGEHWALNHLPELLDTISITYEEKTTVQGRLKAHLKERYEERVMRVTVMEKLHPISELKDLRDLAQVFYDILQIHQWLYECAGILHRDLSFGNIMFRRKNGKVYGVLNDFDLSSRVQDMDNGPTSNQRTGTKPFMSRDLLDLKWKGGHFYRHDLESLFYIILCLACRYAEPGIPAAEPRAYSKWFSGSDEDVFAQKHTFLTDPSDDPLPVQPYFTHFDSWLTFIYNSISTGYTSRPRPRAGTNISLYPAMNKDSAPKISFDWNTLDGRVTYRVFRAVMFSFQTAPLETHWLGREATDGTK
ncbi:protein kinase [Lentinula aciculospora]|uniref:Protein kinase n=1 Tax=Lentinula aciculospora TaxID=153920 RepID=A0A9W9AB57_9AGAR|nr:protein kinase [Lentinula aciculospora]